MYTKFILGLVLSFTILIATGCKPLSESAEDLQNSAEQESLAYDRFVAAANNSASDSVAKLIEWSKSLGDLNGRVSIISQKIKTHNIDLSKNQKLSWHLDALKQRLATVLARPGRKFTLKVSECVQVQAVESAERIRKTMSDLRVNYIDMYGSDGLQVGAGEWMIAVVATPGTAASCPSADVQTPRMIFYWR